MNTDQEQVTLYHISNLRTDEHTPTRAEIESVVDTTTLQTLIDKLDVVFDEQGNLVYAPYPRR